MAFSENTQPSGGTNGSAEKDGERRTLRRKSIKVKKTVLCEMAGQNESEGKNLYFYINDISPGGMKNNQRYIPAGRKQLDFEVLSRFSSGRGSPRRVGARVRQRKL